MQRIGNWLRKIANLVKQALNLTNTTSESASDLSQAEQDEILKAYLSFLGELLQATYESRGDAQVVFPLLAANTDKLNYIFAELLRDWATNLLAEAKPDEAQSIASDIVNFSNLIQQFPLGDKASNMEIAITGYETALTVYTREAFSQDWAMTQNNLGLAYGDRILGERANNLENAIAAYESALEVYTREAFPQDWAATQNNLGAAYGDRILGERANNLENAIAAYESALEVYTREAFPQDWAATQNNLGNAYLYRILGERANNLESAIAAYKSALEVYTREAFPQDWAATQNNLGTAYSDRILGERANNLESAIAAYESALEVYTREAFPQDWAMTQNNLGIAYGDRILGERANNLEYAIAAYKSALEVYTREAFPQQWATTQNNLGEAYRNRILGERANNLEYAIAAYESALEVYTREAFPQQWATTQNNLGNAYSNRILGERANNLEYAIAAYESALKVRTREAFPQDWAATQNNLGNAYSNRILGERANNLEYAIAAYESALEVRTREAFPQNHAETLYNLGILYQAEKQYTSAYNTFESAIETVESLRGEIVSGEESKRKQAEEWNKLYRRMVEVCLALKEDSQAIEFIERSKTRNLVELLFNDECYPKGKIPAEVKNQLQELQQKIEVEKRRLEEAQKNQNQEINRSELHNLRQQREQLMSRVIGFHPIRFSEIQNLLDGETAIIEWYIFGDCFRAFIITSEQDKPEIWHSQAEDLEELRKWIDDYLQLYSKKDKNGKNDKGEWRHYLYNQLTQLAKHLYIDDIVSLVPSKCQKIILVPHLYLHLLPLHALQLASGEYLIDKFPGGVSYAPSCQLLRLAKNKFTPPLTPPRKQGGLAQQDNIFSNLFAIQNPTRDLEFTDIEVETIANRFHPRQILKHSAATEAALAQQPYADYFRNASWLHFSCHGYFNFNSPLKSALQLADTLISPISADLEATRLLKISDDAAINLEKCLTLEDIFNLSFPNCRLVTLSACESGLVDYTNTSDEYIGLPSGFIKAGAANIVSSLWAVDDFSTAILMMRFYENLQISIYDIPLALNQAQKWFRKVTQKDLILWIDHKTEMDAEHKGKVKERLEQNYLPEQLPFKEPCFWAAFCAIGG